MSDSLQIPDSWKYIFVQDAFKLGRGRVISRPEIKSNPGKYPVYSSQSMNEGKMGSIGTYDFDGEYITWTTDGAYAGTVFYRKGKFNCTNVCGTLKDNGNYPVYPRFVAFYLQTVAKNYVSYVGNPKLMNNTFGEIPFLHPPPIEQKKIASILTSVDNVIEKTESQISKLQDLKIGMMQELLTKGIGHTEFKDSPVGRIPESWNVVSLKDVCEKISDGIHTTPQYTNYSEYHFINGNNLKDGRIVIGENTKCVSEEEYLKHKKKLSEKTILMSINGTIGNLAYYNNEEVILGKSAAYISLKKTVIKEYIYYVLESERSGRYFELELTGTTIRNLSLRSIKDMPIAFPSVDEQQQIASILMSLDHSIKAKKVKLGQISLMKKGLMQDLLTGKVRVKVN